MRRGSVRTRARGDKTRTAFRVLPASRVLTLAIAWGAAGSPLSGQTVTGELAGRVLGTDGTPLADVSVTATGADREDGRTVLTDGRGAFRLSLRIGSYLVRLDRIGHRSVV